MDGDSLKIDHRYDAALQMLKQEHTRWYQWALFFFGSIASVFVVWDQVKDICPLWLAALVASAISVMWTVAAFAIYRSSGTWLEILRELEAEAGCQEAARPRPSRTEPRGSSQQDPESQQSAEATEDASQQGTELRQSTEASVTIGPFMYAWRQREKRGKLNKYVSVTWVLSRILGPGAAILFLALAVASRDAPCLKGQKKESQDFFLSGTKAEVRRQLKDVQVWLNAD